MSFDVTTKNQNEKERCFTFVLLGSGFGWIDLPASVGWSDAELKRSKDAISSLSLKVKRSNVLQQTRRKPRAVNSFCWVGVAALQYELLAENARSTKVNRVAQASDSGKEGSKMVSKERKSNTVSKDEFSIIQTSFQSVN